MVAPTRLVITASLLALPLAGCGGPGTSDSSAPSSTTTTTTSRTSPTATTSTSTTTASSTTSAAMTGPQECGRFTAVNGDSFTVTIVSGDHDCAFAEDLLDTYYNSPPSQPRGSGGFVTIDGWDCMTTTLPETERTGVASTCATADGDTITTTAGSGSASPTSDAELGAATPSQSTGSCAQIDQHTLDAMFPDGFLDEEKCRSYIGGENAIDADR